MSTEDSIDVQGVTVTRSDVERELDWLISIEPDPRSPNAMDEYKRSMAIHADRIAQARAVLRRYGEQIQPVTFEAMQAAFYAITQGSKYTRDAISQSVAYSSLNRAWDGVNGWQK